MARITRQTLMTLEAYAKARPEFRTRVLEHKQRRLLHLGDNVTLYFEDELTIRYQVQEMLRAERIFEEDAIQAELDAYAALVPDGSNWKATMMIEYPDPQQRAVMLSKLIGIEDRVWVQVAGAARVYALADEDCDRETDVKTSSVHFLRFELEPGMMRALKHGASLSAGIDHPNYDVRVEQIARDIVAALAEDLST
ncbi:MAG TPA: DUF3501 family protein [Burkholderiales bacterium]|nr:DUF3501 family protein [Burkholderiales bacterium]